MKEISPITGKILALSMLSGIGPATLRKAFQVNGFEEKPVEEIATEVPLLHSALKSGNWKEALFRAEEQLNLSEKLGCQILSPGDDEYPKLLSKTKDDPFLIWVKGSLFSKPEKSVAIIGTREPTAHGQVISKRITRHFVEDGWSIVSGLAIGCDGIAHQEAIDAGGHTVAVLAHGLQTIAPAGHRKLAEDILSAGGALISQYPLGCKPMPQQFAQRDKTQAGMSQGVVMIQSDLKGGSLHASRAALDYDRWLAVPYPTGKDRINEEKKIKANICLANGSDFEKLELLKFKDKKSLKNIIILNGKNDYEKMRCLITCDEKNHEIIQSSIF